MTQIIYLVLHINYQKKNNNNKNKKMQNFLIKHLPTIVGPLRWAKQPRLHRGPFKGATIVGPKWIKVIGIMNIQQIKKVFSKINS